MEQITYLTELHKKLISILEEIGIELQYEVPFLPYQVDIYCQRYHIAFEADGPLHSVKHDRERDKYLWNFYRLPVIRFTMDIINNNRNLVKYSATESVKKYKNTSKDRFRVATEEAPYL